MSTGMPSETVRLCRRAEDWLQQPSRRKATPQPLEETQRLLHELQVHQIELELQNEELRDSRAEVESLKDRYADFYDFSPTWLVSLDRNGAIIQINLAGSRMLDKERSRLVGERFGRFVAAADLAVFNSFLRQVRDTGIKQVCEVAIEVDDRPPVYTRIEAILSHDRQECRAVVVDVTAQKQMEVVLRKNADLLRQTQRIASVGGWEYDVATGKAAWTDEVYRIYEVAADYDPNDIERSIDFYAPEARAMIASAFRRAVEQAEPYDLDLPFIGARGTRKWVRTTGQVERSADDRVQRVFGDIMDITDRILQRDLLERKVHERTVRLRDISVELATTEERERHAIAQELHDGLGQTLSIAKIKLSALIYPDKDYPGLSRLRRQIEETETLIDYANQAVRSLSLQLSPPLLHQLGLMPALEWLADEIRQFHGLHVELRDDGVPRKLDETLLHVVFRATRELLINVAKHAQVDVAEIAAMEQDGCLVLSVTDDGIGFDARAAATAMPTGRGGYGLFSLRERINFLGGDIQVDSTPGDGTVVVLTVPLQALNDEARI
ncbi:MAG: histidine kinase [Proteobacteria bacterium]|nr:histidine kinase [Pseudomonadota bacterium]